MDCVLVGCRPRGQMLGVCQAPYAPSGQPDHFSPGRPALLPGALRRWWENRPTVSTAGAAGQRQSAPEAPLGPRLCLHRPGNTKCG